MRKLIYLLSLVLLMGFSCEKEIPENCITDMVFNKVTVTNTSGSGAGIEFLAEAYGANLCYSFSHFVTEKVADKTYDIRMKASIPCGQPVCAQALYQTTQTGSIPNLVPGTYILRFYNTDTLFTTLSVVVN